MNQERPYREMQLENSRWSIDATHICQHAGAQIFTPTARTKTDFVLLDDGFNVSFSAQGSEDDDGGRSAPLIHRLIFQAAGCTPFAGKSRRYQFSLVCFSSLPENLAQGGRMVRFILAKQHSNSDSKFRRQP